MSTPATYFYATPQQVRESFPDLNDPAMVADSMVAAGLRRAKAVIDAAARQGGYATPFAACPNTPDIINCLAAEWAAAWVGTRPQLSSCSKDLPKNAMEWMRWAEVELDRLRAGDLDVGAGLTPDSTSSLLVSDGLNRYRERVKQHPRYTLPAYPVDSIPVIHPQYGPGYNVARFGGRWGQ
jgi:hypothetical protein